MGPSVTIVQAQPATCLIRCGLVPVHSMIASAIPLCKPSGAVARLTRHALMHELHAGTAICKIGVLANVWQTSHAHISSLRHSEHLSSTKYVQYLSCKTRAVHSACKAVKHRNPQRHRTKAILPITLLDRQTPQQLQSSTDSLVVLACCPEHTRQTGFCFLGGMEVPAVL